MKYENSIRTLLNLGYIMQDVIKKTKKTTTII